MHKGRLELDGWFIRKNHFFRVLDLCSAGASRWTPCPDLNEEQTAADTYLRNTFEMSKAEGTRIKRRRWTVIGWYWRGISECFHCLGWDCRKWISRGRGTTSVFITRRFSSERNELLHPKFQRALSRCCLFLEQFEQVFRPYFRPGLYVYLILQGIPVKSGLN